MVALAAVAAIVLGQLTNRDRRPPGSGRWFLASRRFQAAAFVAMEVVERVTAGAPLADLIHHGLLPTGIAVQIAVGPGRRAGDRAGCCGPPIASAGDRCAQPATIPAFAAVVRLVASACHPGRSAGALRGRGSAVLRLADRSEPRPRMGAYHHTNREEPSWMSVARARGLAALVLAGALLPMHERHASAHAERTVGPFDFEIGFGTEPAYVGQPNSVQLILNKNGKPVTDLGDQLKVTVSFGDRPPTR